MDDWCRLGSLCNSSTTSVRSNLGRTVARAAVRPSGLLLFRSRCTAFRIFTLFLITYFFCFFVLFRSYCFHAQVFRKTLVHEFHISYIAILNDTEFSETK